MGGYKLMINIENGWAEWDWQIGTFRAEVSGVIYGSFTGQYDTAESLAAVIQLTEQQKAELEQEKQDMTEAMQWEQSQI